MLKVFPLVTIPALIRQRRYWLHLAVAISSLIALSIGYFAKHPPDWQIFYQTNSLPVGGMHSGNFGFIYLSYLISNDLTAQSIDTNWLTVTYKFRLIVMISTAFVVFFSKDRRIIIGTSAMLLAHFVSYPHVWEHHISGIIIIGLLLLTVEHAEVWPLFVILTSLTVMAFPTPFAFFDQLKDPQVWDPAANWPRYGSYFMLLPKVIPTVGLYLLCMVSLVKSGFYILPSDYFKLAS